MFKLQTCGAKLTANAIHCNRLKNHIKERIFPLTIIAVPILENNTYVTSMEYSPLIGGFAITLNDGRAAYLTANSLKFDPNVSKAIAIVTIHYTGEIFAASTRHLGSRIGGCDVCQH